jgi:signal transduction histidine kinase
MNSAQRQQWEEQLSTMIDPAKRVEILCSLAEAVNRNEPERALEYVREALALAESMDSDYWRGMSLYWYSSIYLGIRNAKDALVYAQQAHGLFENLGDQLMIYRCKVRIASAYLLPEQAPRAIRILEECQVFFRDNNDALWESYTLMIMGGSFRRIRDHIAALRCLIAALEINEKIGDKINAGLCYNHLGMVYSELNYTEEAQKASLRYLDIMRELGDTRGEMFAFNQLGKLASEQRQFEKAFSYLAEAEKLSVQYSYYRAEIYRNFVSVYLRMGEWDKAVEYGLKALEYCADGRNQHLLPMLYQQIGSAYSHGYKPGPGKEYLMKALEYAGKTKDLNIQLNCYRGLTYVYQDLGEADEVIRCYEEMLRLKDAINNRDKQHIIGEMKTKFEVESTEREKELLQSKNDELSAALAEVQRLNDRLTRLNNEKNEVLGVVAHDLKSPLSGVKMVSSLLKEHHDHLPKEELYHQLDTIERTSDRMLNIATSLLKAQMLEDNDLYDTVEPVHIGALVAAILERYGSAMEQKGISLNFEVPGAESPVVCNRDGLEQVVENLVSNAVKFTPYGRKITVRIKQKKQDRVIEVEDEGPGINPKEKKRLFGKFARLSTRPTGGESTTGLGLWIAKKTMEAMHGKIWYAAAPGGGARFCISISSHSL